MTNEKLIQQLEKSVKKNVTLFHPVARGQKSRSRYANCVTPEAASNILVGYGYCATDVLKALGVKNPQELAGKWAWEAMDEWEKEHQTQ